MIGPSMQSLSVLITLALVPVPLRYLAVLGVLSFFHVEVQEDNVE
jgi:hypothetical protein